MPRDWYLSPLSGLLLDLECEVCIEYVVAGLELREEIGSRCRFLGWCWKSVLEIGF